MGSDRLGRIYFAAVSFISGFLMMAVEVIGKRMFLPFFGSDTSTWANLLAIVLMSTACGTFSYRIYKGDRSRLIPWALLLAVLIYVLPLWIPSVSKGITGFATTVATGSFLAYLICFAPIFFLLGWSFPVLVQGLQEEGSFGKAADAYLIMSVSSTVGGVMGALLPSFVFINLFNMKLSWITTGFAGLLVVVAGLTLVFLRAWKIRELASLSFFIVGLIAVGAPEPEQEKTVLEVIETPVNSIRVKEHKCGRDGALCRSISFGVGFEFQSMARWGEQKWQDFSISNPTLMLGTILTGKENLKILKIGFGAGVLTRDLLRVFPNAEIDVVDTEPKLWELAQKYFGFPQETDRVKYYPQDIRFFLQHPHGPYDIVLMDVANAFGSAIPQAVTVEVFEQLRDVLGPDGQIWNHFWSGFRGPDGKWDQALLARTKTFQRVFPEQNIHLFDTRRLKPRPVTSGLVMVGTKSTFNFPEDLSQITQIQEVLSRISAYQLYPISLSQLTQVRLSQDEMKELFRQAEPLSPLSDDFNLISLYEEDNIRYFQRK